jgi:CSLREA domain-containing protein
MNYSRTSRRNSLKQLTPIVLILGLAIGIAFGGARTTAAQSETWIEQAHQLPFDGQAGNTFGFKVAVDGDTAVVGSAGFRRGGEDNVGAAYVYVRVNGEWVFQQKLMASDGTGSNIFGDQFGAAVGVSGDTIIVGANQDDTAIGVNSGSAYIFTRTNGVWTEQQHLFASSGAPGAAFGDAVAIEGDTAIIGSLWEDSSSGNNAGGAYIFKRSGGIWAQQQRLNSPDSGDGMNFGISVAISGQYIVIGSNVGAYLFFRSVPNWIYAQKWQALDGESNDGFGQSVAVSGDTGVVGAPLDDTPRGTDTGSAYIFQIRNGLEPLQQKVTASNGAENDRYGFSVATNGATVIVGAFNGDTAGEANTGVAYVIGKNGADWEQRQLIVGSDTGINNRFGVGVAMGRDSAIIGAYQHDQVIGANTVPTGGSYIFSPVISVNKTADTDDGVCDAADCSLREAIAVANANGRADIINFNIPANSAGCFGVKCSVVLTRPLAPAADSGFLTIIDGGAAANKIALTGAGANQIFRMDAPSAKVSLKGLTFTDGNDPNGGGAIQVLSGNLTLADSLLFSNGTAGTGGAINCQAGCTLTMTNVTISGNSANNAGSGIYNSGTITASSCTITNNTTNNSGGGIFNLGTFNIRDTIVAGNVSAAQPGVDASGMFNSLGYNLLGKSDGANGFTAIGDQSGTNATPLNARLAPLADNGGKTGTHFLLPGSLAIDKGNSFGFTTDQRGFSRPVDLAPPNAVGGDGSDIGAFENTVTTAASVSISGRVLVDGRGLSNARVTLIDQNGNSRSITTAGFGFFHFAGITAGETVILTVFSKRFAFDNPSHVLNPMDSVTDADFIANP